MPSSLENQFREEADALLKALRDTIDEILPTMAAWPTIPADAVRAQGERQSKLSLAMLRHGQRLAKLRHGRDVAVALVTQVSVVRGPRAETVLTGGGDMIFRTCYEQGKPDRVELRADIRKNR